jgi:hypothetical protein
MACLMNQRVIWHPVDINVWEGKAVLTLHFLSALDVLMDTVQGIR